MSDAMAGRALTLILAIMISIWFVKDMSWKDKWYRFWFRFCGVMFIVRGIGYLVFDILGLFPLD